MRYSIGLLLVFVAAPAFASDPVYTWHYRADEPDRAYLYRDGKQIGGWCYSAKHYRPFDGKDWGAPVATSPATPPARRTPAITIPTTLPSSPRRFGLRGRIEEAAGRFAMEKMILPVLQSMVDQTVNEVLKSITERKYLLDLTLGVRQYAHLEMGGQLDALPIAKAIGDKGAAALLLVERKKFIEHLTAKNFAKPILKSVTIEIEDDDSQAKVGTQQLQVVYTADGSKDPKATSSDARSIPMAVTRRAKDAKEKQAVVVRSSFVYAAEKDGKTADKTLSLELYLEQVPAADSESYPWKVRNVQYK